MLADAMAVLAKSIKNKETNVDGGNNGGIGDGGCSGHGGSGSDPGKCTFWFPRNMG